MSRTILLAAAAICVLGAPAAAEVARVKRVLGSAFVQRAGKQLPATLGLPLDESDTLVTGRDGRIGVTFIDNNRFAVGPNSAVRVATFRFDETTHAGRFERASIAPIHWCGSRRGTRGSGRSRRIGRKPATAP